MKKFLTLKNILLCVAGLFAVAVFVFSFLTSYRVEAGNNWLEYKGIIWGAKQIAYSNGDIKAISEPLKAVALPLVGAILVLVGAVIACVCGLAFQKKHWAKLVVASAATMMVLGGVFCFLYKLGFENSLMAYYGVDSMDKVELVWKGALLSTSIKTSCGLPIVSGILSIVGGCLVFLANLLKK